MNRYIDAEYQAKLAEQLVDGLLENLVEVVRCKDCIHYDEDLEECRHPKSVFLSGIEADGFCHYGERKDDRQSD